MRERERERERVIERGRERMTDTLRENVLFVREGKEEKR